MKGETLTQGKNNVRLDLRCPHQACRVYVIEGAPKNFVCEPESAPAHSLAGFLSALWEMEDPRIKALANEWGLRLRTLKLEE